METPNILLPALRQYQHSDCSGFVSGFEYEETCRIVAGLSAKLRKLVEAAEWRDGVINFYATPQIAFTKNGWWDRLDYENCRKVDAEAAYQVALKAAKEG